jgi:hypothetical protein
LFVEPGKETLGRDEIASRTSGTFNPLYTLDEWLPGGEKAEVKCCPIAILEEGPVDD